MLRVGLTGSIAVGKTYVANILGEFGCRVIDADNIAREVVQPGSQGLKAVVEAFGEGILHTNGTLDRSRLRKVVFGDEEQRQLLNSILHPYIITRQDELLREWESLNPNSIAVVDAALMIESGGYKRFDKLIIVHCRPEIQLERLMKRNNISRAEAEKRVRSQMPQEEKKKFGDYLIDTSNGFESTRTQTETVYRELVQLTQEQST